MENWNIFIQENAFEYFLWKMAAILLNRQYTNWAVSRPRSHYMAHKIIKNKSAIQQSITYHYNDVTMTTTVSQITSLTVVYSIDYSGADQRKHQSSASLAFVRGIHRDRWIPRTKGQ